MEQYLSVCTGDCVGIVQQSQNPKLGDYSHELDLYHQGFVIRPRLTDWKPRVGCAEVSVDNVGSLVLRDVLRIRADFSP
jgi:hypothetical protein